MVVLSIITINLNDCFGLRRSMESVLNQSYRNFEFIVVDGGSFDGSLEVIKEFAINTNRRKQINESEESIIDPFTACEWIYERDSLFLSIGGGFFSEPDYGIYNAMNKGIRHAKGQYCLFLNSGDWLADENILSRIFSEQQHADIVSGDIAFYDTSRQAVKWYVPSPAILTANTLFNGTLSHQATFIKRELFEKYGYYNENLKIASDWLFFVETLLEHHVSYQHFNGLVAYFNMEGISCQPETNNLPRQEQLAILNQKYPRFIPDYDQLKQLEEEQRSWITSKEFRVYQSLKKTGIIWLGVLWLRGVNFIKRKFS